MSIDATLRDNVFECVERWLNEVEEKEEEFPVEFDVLWRLAGYSTKGSAKTSLEKSQLVSDIDYKTKHAFFSDKASLQPKQHMVGVEG